MVIEDGYLVFDEETLQVGGLTLEIHSGKIPIDYAREYDECSGETFWNWYVHIDAQFLISLGDGELLPVTIEATKLYQYLSRAKVEDAIDNYEREMSW